MRSTRRLLDRHSSLERYSAAALVILPGLAACGLAASCSSNDDPSPIEAVDAGSDRSTEVRDAAASDDAPFDAPSTPDDQDAAPFDGGPLPVVCASSPCATSLVTTLPPSDSDPSQGFCALLEDGTVACWGANAAGQLGRGGDAVAPDSATAERVSELSDVVQLSHTCAIDKAGSVWCWGTGPFLRGDGGTVSLERAPVKLNLPPAKSVSVGAEVGCAVVDDDVLCWGKNANGQLGRLESVDPTTILGPRPITLPPGAPVREVHVGKAAFLFRDDGVTVSWGANHLLARVSSLAPDPVPMPIALKDISSVDLTSDTACATVAGVGYWWGRATTTLRRDVPEPVAAPEPLVQIATTRPWRWCAVGASGAVYCRGNNASGQAGDGTMKYADEAVEVQGLPGPAAQVRVTADSTCALLTSGKVYCWGANYYGQLGNGKMRVPSLVPSEVVLP
jgi:alpha-tubulin suppressor-like RCC1 family protein